MGTIVDAKIPTEQFALGDTFEAVPDAEVETVSVAAHKTGHVMPFLRATAPDPEAFHDAIESDSTTETVSRLVDGEDQNLYWVEWCAQVRTVIYALVEEQGTLLDATGREGTWELCVLFPEHDAISSTYDSCLECGIELTIRRSKELTELSHSGVVDLSEEQHEALTAAFESDYYEVPRGATLEELSGRLGVSHQALSERLRRGHRCLIENVLCDNRETIEHEP